MTGKTWGPFTGAQLTMMFLAVTALALPNRLLAVAASAVSVTDAANGHTAAVSSARRLFVSALNEEMPTPAAFFHGSTLGLASGAGCQTLVATPPNGKAQIVTDIRIDVFADPTPGLGNQIGVFLGQNCAGSLIADINPGSVGHYVVPFGPGVSTRSGMSAMAAGGVRAEGYADGYLVPAVQVPAS